MAKKVKPSKADAKAADAKKAQRERDAQLLRDQQADLEKIRRAAEIAPDAWWGRS